MRLLPLSVTGWRGEREGGGGKPNVWQGVCCQPQGNVWHLVTENIMPCVPGIRAPMAKAMEREHG